MHESKCCNFDASILGGLAVLQHVLELVSALPKGAEGLNVVFSALERWGFARAVYAEFSSAPSPKGNALRGASSDYPLDWIAHYTASDYGRIDPILVASRNAVTPIEWSSLQYGSGPVGPFFEAAHAYGVGKFGLTVPVHGPNGRLAVLSVSSDGDEATWRRLLKRRTADVLLVSCHLLERSWAEERSKAPRLSAREKECLQWSAAGKTVQDTAAILGIRERTVRFHHDNARRKLDATNTRHAAAKAMQSGLIAFD